MGKGFGNLAYVRGQVHYVLSPYEQNPFRGMVSKGFPNLMRRVFQELPVMLPPFVLGYAVYAYTSNLAYQVTRKQPGQFDNEVLPKKA